MIAYWIPMTLWSTEKMYLRQNGRSWACSCALCAWSTWWTVDGDRTVKPSAGATPAHRRERDSSNFRGILSRPSQYTQVALATALCPQSPPCLHATRIHRNVTDWDAGAYHRLSEPQLAWGLDVLARLELRGDETAADVGCGTGRLTAQLRGRCPEASHRRRLVEGDARPGAGYLQVKVVSSGRCGRPAVQPCAGPHLQHRHLPLGPRPRPAVRERLPCAQARRTARRPMRRRAQPPAAARTRRRADASSGLRAVLRRLARALELRRRRHDAAAAGDRRVRRGRDGAVPKPGLVRFGRDVSRLSETVCVRHHLARLPPELQAVFTAQLSAQAVGDDPPLTLDTGGST